MVEGEKTLMSSNGEWIQELLKNTANGPFENFQKDFPHGIAFMVNLYSSFIFRNGPY